MLGKRKKQEQNVAKNKQVSDEQILKMAKDKCPKALRGFLPNDDIMLRMIKSARE